MKAKMLLAFLLMTLTSANIVFPYVQPICDYTAAAWTCLQGQECHPDNTCLPIEHIHRRSEDATPLRPDGRCGSEFDGANCDPAGPSGGCCSKYGYCGKTQAYCLKSNGCQSGCMDGIIGQSTGGSSVPPTSPIHTSNSQSQSVATNTRGSEPVIGPVSSTAAATSAAGPVTTNGQCGSTHGNEICGDWPLGSCCSMYGFCGNTSAHCGEGCQSGPCYQAPTPPAPSATPAPANANPGSFDIVGRSGVPAMHAGLLPNGKLEAHNASIVYLWSTN